MMTKSDPRSGSNPRTDQTVGEITSLKVLGARLTRLFLGPAAMILIIWALASKGRGWLSGLNLAFLLVLGVTILGRWVEQRSGASTTMTGQPATIEQCRRYVAVVLVVAAAAWLGANLVGNYVVG